VCVKFCENRSIRSRITAFFRKPLWRSAAILNFKHNDFSGDTKNRKNFLLVHVKFGENRSICCGSTAFLQIKYGGRPPSWIPHNANFEVNLSTGVAFCLCVSNFVKIGRSVPELRHFFEIQYGGRQPSWIPNNANYEVTLRRAVIFWLCA
jgi:hypothetical protein